MRIHLAPFAVLALLAGCAAPPKPPAHAPPFAPDMQVPPFARTPFEPFSRVDAVAIALREWRLWGQHVDDDPPDSHPPPAPEGKPERWPGLWERVGEYWWLGENAGSREAAWTGMHDETGTEFAADRDGFYAWSAAFISYVMRIAGAGRRFPYSESHSDYINAAVTGGYALQAYPPNGYAPQAGDLICTGRGRSANMRFDNLPDGRFPSHCDIVVAVQPGQITVVGGNVDDTVTVKHVPVTAAGMLATPDGTVLDTRYPWFVVIRVLYDR